MQEEVGHLGIFVSGKVAKKEERRSRRCSSRSRRCLRAVRDGNRGKEGRNGKPSYEVSLIELRLEDVVTRLNRFNVPTKSPSRRQTSSRNSIKAVRALWAADCEAFANEYGAKLSREFHPLRFQRWAFSDLNPMAVMAGAGRAGRQGPA